MKFVFLKFSTHFFWNKELIFQKNWNFFILDYNDDDDEEEEDEDWQEVDNEDAEDAGFTGIIYLNTLIWQPNYYFTDLLQILREWILLNDLINYSWRFQNWFLK